MKYVFINFIEFEYFRSRTFLKDDDNYYYRDGEFDYYINENYHVLDRNHDSPVKMISIHDLEVTVIYNDKDNHILVNLLVCPRIKYPGR